MDGHVARLTFRLSGDWSLGVVTDMQLQSFPNLKHAVVALCGHCRMREDFGIHRTTIANYVK